MYKNLKRMDIVLESCCDVISFIPEEIECIFFDGLTDQRTKYYHTEYDNRINCDKLADEIFINIKSRGNTLYNEFGMDNYQNYKFDRLLKCNDITNIDLYYMDGTSECFVVPWNDESEDENRYQHSKIIIDENNNGNLIICIKKEDEKENEINISNIDLFKADNDNISFHSGNIGTGIYKSYLQLQQNQTDIEDIEIEVAKNSILCFINRLKNSGMGKQKSLEYLYKFVDRTLKGDNIINE